MISKWLHCTLRIIQPFVTYEPTVSHRKFTDDPVCRAFFQSKYYPTVLLHTQIKCTLQSVVCELGCSQKDCVCVMFDLFLCRPLQENEILTEQEELISLEQVLRRQIATEKEEIERLRAEIADIQR